jgi:hypothetical protein
VQRLTKGQTTKIKVITLADAIVSIRVPSSIVKELRILAEKNHFMDVSEEVRSVAREKWLTSKDPVLHELKILKNEITKNVESKKQENIIQEIQKVKDELHEMFDQKIKKKSPEKKWKKAGSKSEDELDKNFIHEIKEYDEE